MRSRRCKRTPTAPQGAAVMGGWAGVCVRWSAAACAYRWRCGGGRGEGKVVEGGAGCVRGAHHRPNYPSIPLLPTPHASPPTRASLTHPWWCTESFRGVGCMWGRLVHLIAHVGRDYVHGGQPRSAQRPPDIPSPTCTLHSHMFFCIWYVNIITSHCGGG